MISVKIIWLIIAIVFGLIELFTLSLTTIWFSIGAICALIISIFVDSYIAQFIVFLVVSLVLLFIATKTLIKMDRSKDSAWKSIGTNVDSIIGQRGFVTSEISPEKVGIVKVKSEDWSAISVDANDIIPVGTEVIVNKVEGVKVVVTPI